MNRTKCLAVVAALISLSTAISVAEEHFENLSTMGKLTRALKISSIQQARTQATIRDFAQRLEHLEASDCLLLKMVEEVEQVTGQNSAVETKLIRLDRRITEQERLYLDIKQQLQASVDTLDANVSLRLDGLAKKIAGIENSRQYALENVVPFVRDAIASQQRLLDNQRRSLEVATAQYEQKYRSLCERLSAVEVRVVKRPVAGSPTPAPPLGGHRFHPKYITPFQKQYCTRDLVQQCYDYTSRDGSGRDIHYHGHLYRSCNGDLVLVAHTP